MKLHKKNIYELHALSVRKPSEQITDFLYRTNEGQSLISPVGRDHRLGPQGHPQRDSSICN